MLKVLLFLGVFLFSEEAWVSGEVGSTIHQKYFSIYLSSGRRMSFSDDQNESGMADSYAKKEKIKYQDRLKKLVNPIEQLLNAHIKKGDLKLLALPKKDPDEPPETSYYYDYMGDRFKHSETPPETGSYFLTIEIKDDRIDDEHFELEINTGSSIDRKRLRNLCEEIIAAMIKNK